MISDKQSICVDDDNTKGKREKSAELPTEIWIEIMWKLSIKSLHICKSVSKTWRSVVAHVLSRQEGIKLPPFGLLFQILRRTNDGFSGADAPVKPEHYLGYLSLLGDNKFTKLLVDDRSESGLGLYYDGHGDGFGFRVCLGDFTVDFGSLMGAVKTEANGTEGYTGWSMHRGLILVILHSRVFQVHNPATKEVLVLPPSPFRSSGSQASHLVAIVNLSNCPLSSRCEFNVVRFYKERRTGGVFVEVYSSDKQAWSSPSRFRLRKTVVYSTWSLSKAVYLDSSKTLFFLTNKRHVVGVQFDTSGRQVSSLYYLRLPRLIVKGFYESRLDVSQGCLYLSYEMFPEIWIWKHTGDSDAWIPQLIFKESEISLCHPVINKFLQQSSDDDIFLTPIIMHPEAPVVFIFAQPAIFAIHLLNDTVEKVVELNQTEIPLSGRVRIYSPCFASLKSLGV